MLKNANYEQYLGKTFGKLLFLEITGVSKLAHKRRQGLFRCECSKEIERDIINVINGTTKSCGCFRAFKCKENFTTHKMGGTPTHQSWSSMHTRCTNVNSDNYKWYGGRGITICKAWDSFEQFLSDMGARPEGMTLDRIDSNGNYEPSNCKWSTHEEQMSNRRYNKEVYA